MLCVSAERRDVLLLFVFVANLEGAGADGGIGGALGVATAVAATEHGAGSLTDQGRRGTLGNAATGAHADTLVLDFEVGDIAQVVEAKGAGRQAVLVGIGGAGNHGAIQLGMLADVDIKAALARIQPGLLLDAVEVAADLVTADVEVTATVHRAKGEAYPARSHQAGERFTRGAPRASCRRGGMASPGKTAPILSEHETPPWPPPGIWGGAMAEVEWLPSAQPGRDHHGAFEVIGGTTGCSSAGATGRRGAGALRDSDYVQPARHAGDGRARLKSGWGRGNLAQARLMQQRRSVLN